MFVELVKNIGDKLEELLEELLVELVELEVLSMNIVGGVMVVPGHMVVVDIVLV